MAYGRLSQELSVFIHPLCTPFVGRVHQTFSLGI